MPLSISLQPLASLSELASRPRMHPDAAWRSAVSRSVRSNPPWRQPRGKSQVNLRQMLPLGGSISMGVDSRNYLFAPGLSPGWCTRCGTAVFEQPMYQSRGTVSELSQRLVETSTPVDPPGLPRYVCAISVHRVAQSVVLGLYGRTYAPTRHLGERVLALGQLRRRALGPVAWSRHRWWDCVLSCLFS